MSVRNKLPKSRGRKIYHLISDQLKAKNIKMSRDKLSTDLREERLLVPNRKKYDKTTNSRHWNEKTLLLTFNN